MASRATGCRRTAVFSFVLAVFMAAPAAAPAKRHDIGKKVTEEQTVTFASGDAARTVILNCPEPFRLLTATWEELGSSSSSQAITVVSSESSTGATFEINTRATAATVVVRIICFKKKTKRSRGGPRNEPHSHDLKQQFVSQPVALPGRGEFTTTAVSCPNGFMPLSGFFDGDQSSRVTQSMPGSDGQSWQFGIEQLSSQDASGTVGAQCQSKKTGRSAGHRHRVKAVYVSKQVEVPSSFVGGEETNVHVSGSAECPDGSFPVGAGWSFLGHPHTFLSGFRVAGSGRKATARAKPSNTFGFDILNQSTEQTATVIASCLANTTTNGN